MKLQKTISITIFALLFLSACSKNTVLQDQKNDENVSRKYQIEYEDWILVKEGSKCFIASFPISSAGDFFERKLHYLMLIMNPSIKQEELVIVGGARYQEESLVRLQVEDISFFLNVKSEQAWASDEPSIISKIKMTSDSSILVFSSFSKGDFKTIDKYSLFGFNEAHNQMLNICGK